MSEPKPLYTTQGKPTIRVDILENLLSVLTEEEALMFSQRLKLCRERAKKRECVQSVSVVLNNYGCLHKLTLTDDVMRPPKSNT